MKRVKYISFLCLLGLTLLSCVPDKEAKTKVDKSLSSQNALLNNTHILDATSCTPGAKRSRSCASEIAGAYVALKEETCVSSGNSWIASGSCQLISCMPGQQLLNGACVGQSCNPGQWLSESCIGEKPGATEAYHETICLPDGSGFATWGTCRVLGCQNGYDQFGNNCVASNNPCEASLRENEVCTNELVDLDNDGVLEYACSDEASICLQKNPGAEEINVDLLCNSEGTGKVLASPCMVNEEKGCKEGYHFKNGNCVPGTCVPGFKDISVCIDEIPGAAIANKERICESNGTNFTEFGSCNLVSCLEGFTQVGNQCVGKVCTPNQELITSCKEQVANSRIAEKVEVCAADGASYTVKETCTVKQCADNHYLNRQGTCSLFADEALNVYEMKGFADGFTEGNKHIYGWACIKHYPMPVEVVLSAKNPTTNEVRVIGQVTTTLRSEDAVYDAQCASESIQHRFLFETDESFYHTYGGDLLQVKAKRNVTHREEEIALELTNSGILRIPSGSIFVSDPQFSIMPPDSFNFDGENSKLKVQAVGSGDKMLYYWYISINDNWVPFYDSAHFKGHFGPLKERLLRYFNEENIDASNVKVKVIAIDKASMKAVTKEIDIIKSY